jgi:RimJ/RimL family protein N-acetyltransferase
MSSKFRFSFKHVEEKDQALILSWLGKPHVAEWFYGQGLQNTKDHLEDICRGKSETQSWQYWLGYDRDHPFAFFITSLVQKSSDELSRWCKESGEAITLDMLIGDTDYLGKELACQLIREFLLSHFPSVTEVLIDPEATNSRAVHVYQKAGFEIVGEFIPSHSPNLHYMMRLNMRKLRKHC